MHYQVVRNCRDLRFPHLPVVILTVLLSIIRADAVPGNLDWSFGSGGKVSVHVYGSDSPQDVEIQPDGKIVVAATSALDSNRDFTLIRLNPDGSLDTGFGDQGKVRTSFDNFNSRDDAWAMTLQPDGKIIVVGTYTGPLQREIAAARYNTDGSLDLTFDGDGKLAIPFPFLTFIFDVELQTDGKIVLGGSCGDGFIAVRLNENGTLDTGFDGDGIVVTAPASTDAQAFAVAIQADSKIILAGMSRGGAVGTGHDFALVRYNTDGSLDTSFGGDGKVTTPIGSGSAQEAIFSLALQPDGKIVAGGYTSPDFFAECVLARYEPNGSFDASFGTGGKTVTALDFGDCAHASVQLQGDGRIAVSGQTGAIGTYIDYSVGRYTANGFPDRSFGNGGTFSISFQSGEDRSTAVDLQADGKLVAVGFGTGDFIVTRHVVSGVRVADFDGDIKTDLSIFRPSNAEWWINRSSNGTTFAAQFGATTDRIVPGDYTGDGKTDIAIWRPSSGEWFVLRSEDSSFFSFPFGTTGDTPMPADYDNDGKSDAAVFRESTSTWFVRRSSDGGTTIEGFGANGDVPVVADYDGDGKSDIAIYRPSLGQWWINRSASGVIAFTFGTSTDKPVQGDYTGDGKADVAFFRPSSGEWYILRSEDFGYYSQPFGATNDIPAPGDYDGDGRSDPTVFRPSSATWFSQRSTAGTLIQQFGATGDQPVPSAFVQ